MQPKPDIRRNNAAAVSVNIDDADNAAPMDCEPVLTVTPVAYHDTVQDSSYSSNGTTEMESSFSGSSAHAASFSSAFSPPMHRNYYGPEYFPQESSYLTESHNASTSSQIFSPVSNLKLDDFNIEDIILNDDDF
jgi:hypothetical protein